MVYDTMAERRSKYNHPWARQGSKASRSIGANRWFSEGDTLLLPTADSIYLYGSDIISGAISSDSITSSDVQALFNSETWEWIKQAHNFCGEINEYNLTAKEISDEFGANQLTPIDIISMFKDCPKFIDFFFNDFSVDKILQLDEGQTDNVIRVAIDIYSSLISHNPRKYQIEELISSEPSKILFSSLLLVDEEPNFGMIMIALSNALVDFSKVVSVINTFQKVPDIAVASLTNILSHFITLDDHDKVILPASIHAEDGLARWMYDSYINFEKDIKIGSLGIPISILVDYAEVGVYNPLVIKKFLNDKIDPQLAAALEI